MRYLVGPFIANGVNLLQNDFVAGLPSPLAALGFAGAAIRNVEAQRGLSSGDLDPWSASALPILHSVSLSKGRQRAEPKRGKPREDYSQLQAIELPETLTGEVIASILIETDAVIDEAELRRAVQGMRFAGGTLKATGNRLDGVAVRRLEENTLKEAKGLQRGFAMMPPVGRDDAMAVSFGDEDTMRDVFIRLNRRTEKSGYLVPAAVGLRLLESPDSAAPRSASRDPVVPHVFSEPAAGIAELVSIRNPRLRDAPDLSPMMWRWSPTETHSYVMFSNFHLRAVA